MIDKKEYASKYYIKNKNIIKNRAKQWYRDNKDKALKRLKITNKEWRNNNRDKTREMSYRYSRKWPWVRTYRSINTRCGSNNFYINRGIKTTLTVTQLKMLWFRDKAYKMTKPSIDRINREKGYFLENCRYIEMNDNLKRRVFEKHENQHRLQKPKRQRQTRG